MDYTREIIIGLNGLPIAQKFVCKPKPEVEMNQDGVPPQTRSRGIFRVITTIAAIVLIPPFVVLAIAPMLLLLLPVALIGIPFIIPAMLSGSLAAREEDIQRASWRPPVPAPLQRLHLVSVDARTKG
jgi:hypothetical protein